MAHCVHQLVTNFVCLLFGAEQVEYSEYWELFHWKQGAVLLMKAVRVKQNSEAAGHKTKTMNWKVR